MMILTALFVAIIAFWAVFAGILYWWLRNVNNRREVFLEGLRQRERQEREEMARMEIASEN